MRKIHFFPLFLLLALLAIAVLSHFRTQVAPLDHTFKIIDGREIKLAALQGQPVLINFWSTSCAICLEEMPDLVKLYETYHPAGFELLSVSMPYDRPDVVIELSRELALPFPVALDVYGETTEAFGGIQATPTHILIDKDGKMLDRFVGRIDPAKLERFLQQSRVTQN